MKEQLDAGRENLVLQKIESFPVLPGTVIRVLEVTSDPESSAQDLMKAVLPDQAMCVSILKIANSALFGQPQKVSSIERAIVVLGFSEIQSIVLGKAVIGSFAKLTKSYQHIMDDFWQHSFTCGLAAKIMAEHMALPSGDLFVAGLIHDIGKLALFLTFPDDYDPKIWMSGHSSAEKLIDEKQQFSVDHCTVGRKLLDHWSFPANLLVFVGYHHEPFASRELRGYPLLIQLADVLAHFCEHPELLVEVSLDDLIEYYLPDIKAQWRGSGLVWDKVVVESWFNWLKIDKEHGGSILSMLIS